MQRPVGLGILGCGRVALDVHLPALARHHDVRIAGGADPDPSRRAAAARAGVPEPAATQEELLADPAVEAILVATPPEAHAAGALAAVEAGRHVLVEKPVATSPADARAVAARAAETGRVAAAGHQLRCHPGVESLRARVAGGKLGRIVEVRARWVAGSPGAFPLLLDLGVHHLDLWPWFLDDPWSELSLVSGGPGGNRVEIAGTTASGARIAILLAREGSAADGGGLAHRLEIIGERGHRTLDLYRPRGLARFRRHGATRAAFRRQWTRFACSVRDGAPVACSIEDGARAVEAALALSEAEPAAPRETSRAG